MPDEDEPRDTEEPENLSRHSAEKGPEGAITRTTSADGSRPLTERDSDSLWNRGGGCVDRSWTTGLRPSDTEVGAANFAPAPLFHRAYRLRTSYNFHQ